MKLKSFITVDTDYLSQNFEDDKVVLVSWISVKGNRTQDANQAVKFSSSPEQDGLPNVSSITLFINKHFPDFVLDDDGTYSYKNEVIAKYMC